MTLHLADSHFLKSIPIFLTAFGFHGNIPSLIDYVHGERTSIYKALFWGSVSPLCVYILWQLVAIGTLGNSLMGFTNVGQLTNQLAHETTFPPLQFLTNTFTFFAVSTSFLGVGLGLFDYIREWFPVKEGLKARGRAFCLAFIPPLFFALFYPDGFVFALGFAAIALSVLGIILPACVALKQKNNIPSLFHHSYFLVAMIAIGVFIILLETINKCVGL
jgi:tyrosine-specific transport protein